MSKKKIRTAAPQDSMIRMTAPAEVLAAETDAEGNAKGPPKFNVTAYTGGAMRLAGWEHPVVVDLDGMKFGNSLVANLDHDSTKRVGNVSAQQIKDGQLILEGTASAATESRREVVESAGGGFVWQASIEAQPDVVAEVASGETVSANGQEFQGPLFLAQQSTLKGFAFVSHGADDNTQVQIAATADSKRKANEMDKELKAWIEGLGLDVETLTEDQVESLKANYNGQNHKPKKRKASDPFEERKLEAKRREDIREIADNMMDRRNSHREEIEAIEKMHDHAIETGMDVRDFRAELQDAILPMGTTIHAPTTDSGVNARMLEAAVCMTGRLDDIEKHFDDRTLQAAKDRFKENISLNELVLEAAAANGSPGRRTTKVSPDALRAAFGTDSRPIHGAGGFSTLSIANVLSNVANKFLRRGWDAVDMTPMRIASVRSVSDFKTITTVSLTGDLTFEKVGADGEIKHGTLGEETYSNKADTYGRMLAITRTDFINDDLGALTDVPRKLGRGAGLKLNDIFWTEFLDNSSFFTSGNSNVSTDTGELGTTGLEEADTVFMNQTDPDGNPLGIMPAILLVPTALKATARQLMESEKIKGNSDEPDANIWRGRFRTESSPYMSNSNYTGNSSIAWYLLADPNELPVIEIAALNGRVEPVVENADADFNVLGVQMRGYSDVGVAKQEHRGGVRADGSAAG